MIYQVQIMICPSFSFRIYQLVYSYWVLGTAPLGTGYSTWYLPGMYVCRLIRNNGSVRFRHTAAVRTGRAACITRELCALYDTAAVPDIVRPAMYSYIPACSCHAQHHTAGVAGVAYPVRSRIQNLNSFLYRRPVKLRLPLACTTLTAGTLMLLSLVLVRKTRGEIELTFACAPQ